MLIDYNINLNIIISIYKKEQTLNKEKQISTITNNKSTKKKNNNTNLKLVDQLILKKKKQKYCKLEFKVREFKLLFFY